ncbi:MAG: cobalt chelatase [Firmicutes bacterium HGW-Firmicutes-8]|nr:MAG: cobalt chelatase [Firmicutes bacterium HGW-Firmicutes-8]
MKIGSIMWGSYIPPMAQAGRELEWLELNLRSMRDLEDITAREAFLAYLRQEADVLLLFPSTNEVWDELVPHIEEIRKVVPTVAFGYDPSVWTYSTVHPEIAATVHRYLTIGGTENSKNALKYIAREVHGLEVEAGPPEEVPWQGIYYPGAESYFSTIEEFYHWHQNYRPDWPSVGILFYRSQWVNGNNEVVDALIQEFARRGINGIPVFSHGWRENELGAMGNDAVFRNFFFRDGKPVIDALVNLQSFFLVTIPEGSEQGRPGAGNELLKELDIPVFNALLVYSKTEKEWRADTYGLAGPSLVMSVAMPEFNGVIEPIVVGCTTRSGDETTGVTIEKYRPILQRVQYLARRVQKWIKLRRKQRSERKVVFILNNNPCAGVEANVGAGTNLDTLESVVRIMHRMQQEGYTIENLPASGEEMINTIMERKAISDFRWTPIDEIIKKGGVLSYVTREQYLEWFETFSPAVKQSMIETWGNPPGEEINGVPAAMVYEGKIVVTGVRYGNVVVGVQPKRGCAGARCDGQVCKILHDPQCPPTHQYVATYRYWEEVWGADAIVHVGTHGNLEFLPGKSVGLSDSCFPEIGLGTVPHLYIYNADNPPEGTIAKRRSYATLVDHMQTVMTESGTYEQLRELEQFLGEYNEVQGRDPARAHALEHLIMDKIKEANLEREVNLQGHRNFDQVVKRAHEVLTRLRDSQVQDGLHIFGDIPTGERRMEFINSILRHDFGEDTSLRRVVCELMGLDYDLVMENPGEWYQGFGKTYGELLVEAQGYTKEFIRRFLAYGNGSDTELDQLAGEILGDRLVNLEAVVKLAELREKVLDLNERIEASKEIDSLLHGFDGGYIESGPSGLITRGRVDILPTGRNFYSLDPHKIPTKAAWRVGRSLANALVEKHTADTGRFPENCAMVLFGSDVMWTDGEQVSQILYLLGVEPKWLSSGQVKGFRIIPLEELNRPRIDVTLRIGGVTRDCFPSIIEYLDEAIQVVADQDEPLEMNFIRKHALEQLGQEKPTDEAAWRRATARIFGSRPGTYGSGVNLAVYASAWKEEQDLADIYVYWSGYAYGKGNYGQEAHQQFINQLKSVDLTFNKTATDEYDLFGCCCYYSYYGGLTAAAKAVSGREVKTYYGDTRDPARAKVTDLAEEINRVVRTKLLNPKWIEGMKRHGYKGASDISKRIGRVYGWEATTRQVDDWVFDDITRTYILDEEMRKWFAEKNPWALEEIGRRLLEANQRQLWDADPEVLEGLQEAYLEIEGWMEELMGDVEGEFQGGAIDIMNMDEVEDWGAKMKEIREKLRGKESVNE